MPPSRPLSVTGLGNSPPRLVLLWILPATRSNSGGTDLIPRHSSTQPSALGPFSRPSDRRSRIAARRQHAAWRLTPLLPKPLRAFGSRLDCAWLQEISH